MSSYGTIYYYLCTKTAKLISVSSLNMLLLSTIEMQYILLKSHQMCSNTSYKIIHFIIQLAFFIIQFLPSTFSYIVSILLYILDILYTNLFSRRTFFMQINESQTNNAKYILLTFVFKVQYKVIFIVCTNSKVRGWGENVLSQTVFVQKRKVKNG